jgi:hypothetical protein
MEWWAMLQHMCYASDLVSFILITWGVDHHMHFDITCLCFALTEPRQKTLDLETSCQMLELVLGQRPLVPSFIQFLEVLNLFIGSFVTICLLFKPAVIKTRWSKSVNTSWPLISSGYGPQGLQQICCLNISCMWEACACHNKHSSLTSCDFAGAIWVQSNEPGPVDCFPQTLWRGNNFESGFTSL